MGWAIITDIRVILYTIFLNGDKAKFSVQMNLAEIL